MVTVLGGCAPKSLIRDVTGALIDQQFGRTKDPITTAKLNPAYRYLRVEVVGKPAALLVLGYVDAHPQGDVEVWYSARHEVIKTQHGRIVSTAGLEVDWRSVRFSTSIPSWDMVQSSQLPFTFRRWRDEMPGYRFDIADELTLQHALDLPTLTLPRSFPIALVKRYTWFQESSSTSSDAANPWPASWYGLQLDAGEYRVAYSFQCLTRLYCLSLQRWPVGDVGL